MPHCGSLAGAAGDAGAVPVQQREKSSVGATSAVGEKVDCTVLHAAVVYRLCASRIRRLGSSRPLPVAPPPTRFGESRFKERLWTTFSIGQSICAVCHTFRPCSQHYKLSYTVNIHRPKKPRTHSLAR